MNIKTSKKYSKLVPRPTKEEYDVIKESILIYGQREPIVVNPKGIVLDGHTRFDILVNRGLPINIVKREFESEDEEELYVIQCNLQRRQLTIFQKAELTYEIYKITKLRMKHGGDTRNRTNTGGASAIIGKTIGCNRNMLQMAVWLIENADDTLKSMLRNGTKSISNAYREICLNKVKNQKIKDERSIRSSDKLECPHCHHELKKKELIIKN